MMIDTNVHVPFTSDIGSREFDIANTHDDNLTLFEREDVKTFYDKIDGVAELTEDFIAWLGSIPHTMSNTAIPLFRESKSGTDYQVHPCYSQLKRYPSSSTIPHFYVSSMYLHRGRVLVIPFGRLFVNMPVDMPVDLDQTGRLSKWTGYEVLFGVDKKLWFVFNDRSLPNRWSGWYPVRCNLGGKTKRDEGADSSTLANLFCGPSPAASLNEVIESPDFRSAYVLLTESTLSSMSFAEVQEQIQHTMEQGPEIFIGDVDESVVDRELQQLLE